jgi:hypothetical protein
MPRFPIPLEPITLKSYDHGSGLLYSQAVAILNGRGNKSHGIQGSCISRTALRRPYMISCRERAFKKGIAKILHGINDTASTFDSLFEARNSLIPQELIRKK